MKKKPTIERRPQEIMARFDRLLATMAPKPAAPDATRKLAKARPAKKKS